MKVIETAFDECFLIEHDIYQDMRGSFFEVFNQKEFKEISGLDVEFVQDNVSFSLKGVLRGLHFQEPPHQQAKLVTVLSGRVLDVVVDLRKGSKTFGQHLKFDMNSKTGHSLFVPKGMAHGFLALSEVLFHYKCDNYYHPESESGIIYSDEELNIDWQRPEDSIILSAKDKNLQTFNTYLK